MFKLAERTTGAFAVDMIRQSGLAEGDHEKLVVLDNACGTGVVSATLIEGGLLNASALTNLDLTCADFAEHMINATKIRAEENGWTPLPKTVQADAMDTRLPSAHFTHILFNFGPMLLAVPFAGVCECRRMLRPGGVLAFTTWHTIPWIEDYVEAWSQHPELAPCVKSQDELRTLVSKTPDRWDDAYEVRRHLQLCGFVDINVRTISHHISFSLDEVRSFAPGTLVMFASRLWTKEQRDVMTRPAVEAIVEYLRQKHGESVTWEWIALVTTARRPE
jgi:ubiquinone/menaquinone biosynthesis C-methylase UbiE